MEAYPQEFDKQKYIDWHNKNIEPGKDLLSELGVLLKALKNEQRERLTKLAELLSRMHSFHLLAKKVQKEDISDSDTEIQLEECLRTDEKYENLYKSIDSIIDKLWRKNKERTSGQYITIDNIKTEIGDLIRTSLITSTFSYAESFTNSIGSWREIIKEIQLNEQDYSDISSIEAQEEAKMQNGYFAYHLDVLYKDGLRVEIQVYSRLSEIWRHLSHKLYDKVRLGEDVDWGHGTAASRLVSLGHLLHLAECEVEYLKSAIK